MFPCFDHIVAGTQAFARFVPPAELEEKSDGALRDRKRRGPDRMAVDDD